MNSVVLLLLSFVALAASTHHEKNRILGVSLHSTIQLTVKANAYVNETSIQTLEDGLFQFLDQYLDSYNVTDVAVQSQTLQYEDTLNLVLALAIQATGVGDLSSSIIGKMEEHDEALELYFTTTFGFGSISSLRKLEGIPSQNSNRAPFYSNDMPSLRPTMSAAPSPAPRVVLPTLPPLEKASSKQTPQPTFKGAKDPPPPEGPSYAPSMAPPLENPSSAPSMAPPSEAPSSAPSVAPLPETPSSAPSVTPLPKAPSSVPSVTPLPKTPSSAPSVTPLPKTPSSAPSVAPSLTYSDTPSSVPSQAYENLPNKSYQTHVTVKLFGILSAVPQNETDLVESTTLSFLQDNLPPVARVILEVMQVGLRSQTLQRVNSLGRRLQSNVLLLDLDIGGEGWSTNQDRLDAVNFDGLVRYALLAGYDDYVKQLQAIDTLSDAEIPDEGDSLTPFVTPQTGDTASNTTSILIPVVITAVGVTVLAAVLCAFIIFRRSGSSTTTTNADSRGGEMDVSIDAESPYYDDDDGAVDGYPSEEEDSYFQTVPRIISPDRASSTYPIQELDREKYAVKEAFGASAVSALSNSIYGDDNDFDGWSVTSGIGTIKTVGDAVEVKFSMDALDEFDTKLASNSQDAVKRRLFVNNDDDDDKEEDEQ